MDIIVCVDSKFGFSKENTIPWHNKSDILISDDCKSDIDYDYDFFKKTTIGTEEQNNIVIMGSKTALTLPRPLKLRMNFVVTTNEITNKDLSLKGFVCFPSLTMAVDYGSQLRLSGLVNKIFLIGGQDIYNYGLVNSSQIQNVYITQLNKNYNCDRHIDHNLLVKNFALDEVLYQTEFMRIMKYVPNFNREEQHYLDLLRYTLENGHKRQTRNAITYSVFGKTLEFDLKNKFPLLTTKKTFLKGIFEELKFFIMGKTNNKILQDKGVKIWDGNTTKEFIDKCNLPYNEGDMGPMYGFNWRHFGAKYVNCETEYKNSGFDQLSEVINLLNNDPFSRRMIMTTFNPAVAKEGVLYPCHGISIQFYVEEYNDVRYLNCMMHQRSSDSFLGLPFNIASYALLVYIICKIIGNICPGRLIMTLGDVHIYGDHYDAVIEQLKRTPYNFPQLNINFDLGCVDDICNLEFEHIQLINYVSCNGIKAKMIA